ncbi:MAG TPA: hypothetical protein VK138_08785 [Acidiferrobacterales bacterium]|nr:hypothetical protein [Acidiferrobacterales bacterium]
MQPFYILNLQSTFTLIAFSLIAKWYINPRLSKTSVEDALLPLVWVHVFRYAPLTLLVPGQVSPDLPIDVARTIAYGDLISAIAALITVLFLKQRLAGALVVAWIFNLIGFADIVITTNAAISAKLYQYPIGFNWYIVNFYVPVLIVTHAMMIYKLVYAKK